MKEQFVPYDIALKLKQKGFDEPCFGTYNSFGDFILSNSEYPLNKNSDKLYDDIWLKHIQKDYPEHTPDMLCTAPLWQQVFDWLREKHNLHVVIYKSGNTYAFDIGDYSTGYNLVSYHEIKISSIKKALTLI